MCKETYTILVISFQTDFSLTVQGTYVGVCPVGLFLSNTQDFAFAPLEKMSAETRFQFNLQAFEKNVHSNRRCGLKKF